MWTQGLNNKTVQCIHKNYSCVNEASDMIVFTKINTKMYLIADSMEEFSFLILH